MSPAFNFPANSLNWNIKHSCLENNSFSLNAKMNDNKFPGHEK